jgi:hypothetical protein
VQMEELKSIVAPTTVIECPGLPWWILLVC